MANKKTITGTDAGLENSDIKKANGFGFVELYR